jgi:hypothetical protein
MKVGRAIALGLAGLCLAELGLASAPARAGPCAGAIYDAEIAIGKRLNAAAAAGKYAPESKSALLHRQPTPQSVAGAEEKAGDLSEADAKAVDAFMHEAREADERSDLATCRKALSDLRVILGR